MKYVLIALSLSLVTAAYADVPAPVNAISKEPLYAGIIKRANALKKTSDGLAAQTSLSLLTSAKLTGLRSDLVSLSERNMQASLDLKARGTDNDLKCVLKGVSIDLKIKADSLKTAKTDAELKSALTATSELLSDNIDVIVTPATAQSGMDCILEFGG